MFDNKDGLDFFLRDEYDKLCVVLISFGSLFELLMMLFFIFYVLLEFIFELFLTFRCINYNL